MTQFLGEPLSPWPLHDSRGSTNEWKVRLALRSIYLPVFFVCNSLRNIDIQRSQERRVRIIDVWMQTGGTGSANQGDIFSTLTRWTRAGDDTPKNDEHYAITKMDEGGVDIGLIAAWCGPQGFSITWHAALMRIQSGLGDSHPLISIGRWKPYVTCGDG